MRLDTLQITPTQNFTPAGLYCRRKRGRDPSSEFAVGEERGWSHSLPLHFNWRPSYSFQTRREQTIPTLPLSVSNRRELLSWLDAERTGVHPVRNRPEFICLPALLLGVPIDPKSTLKYVEGLFLGLLACFFCVWRNVPGSVVILSSHDSGVNKART